MVERTKIGEAVTKQAQRDVKKRNRSLLLLWSQPIPEEAELAKAEVNGNLGRNRGQNEGEGTIHHF